MEVMNSVWHTGSSEDLGQKQSWWKQAEFLAGLGFGSEWMVVKVKGLELSQAAGNQ